MNKYSIFRDDLSIVAEKAEKNNCVEVNPNDLFSFPHNCIGCLFAVN